MDGSGRITKRNRRFLRPNKAYKDVITQRAEPKYDNQPVDKVVRPQEIEVANSVTDTTGYSTLMPGGTANRPEGTVNMLVGTADMPVGTANMPSNTSCAPGDVHSGSGDGPVLRRSTRDVWRPVSYGL